MVKPGVTEELRTRAGAHMGADARRWWLTAVVVVLAVIAVCAFVILRWVA